MYYGYARLHSTEIWNNQRTLDYLFGDPDNGIAGLGSPFSAIYRSTECDTALPLFCDGPVGLASVNLQGYVSKVGSDSFMTIFTSASVDGSPVDSFTFQGDVALVYSDPAWVSGQPIPPVPDIDDPLWVQIGPIPPQPVPSVPSPQVVSDPSMFRSAIMLPGLAEPVVAYAYADPAALDPALVAISFDDGVTWEQAFDREFSVRHESVNRYSNPAIDDAPWYDPAVPESQQFAGLFVEEVVGLDAMTRRQIEDSAVFGGTLGPLNFTTRSVTVTGWLYAGSCCAADYGLHWLTEALIGDNDCDSCSLGDLSMLKCCPPGEDDDPYYAAAVDGGYVGTYDEWLVDSDGGEFPYVRFLYRVGLTDGPKVVDRMGTCCHDCNGTAIQVQFTVTAENPDIFSPVTWAIHHGQFTEGPFHYDLFKACEPCPQPTQLNCTLIAKGTVEYSTTPPLLEGASFTGGDPGVWKDENGNVIGYADNDTSDIWSDPDCVENPAAGCIKLFSWATWVPPTPVVPSVLSDATYVEGSPGVWVSPGGTIIGYSMAENTDVWSTPSCAINPDIGCGEGVPEPPVPFIIQDDCYCEPWTTMRVAQHIENVFQWNDMTSYIEVEALEGDVKNIKIVAFKNPLDKPCPLEYEYDDEWRCIEPCASIAVSRVPSGARLVIDSRVRSIELILAGGRRVPGLGYVSSGDTSKLFDWFDIGPCAHLCVVASVQASSADSARLSVGFANRYHASGG